MTELFNFQMQTLAELVMRRCDELASISQSETGVDRQYLTPEHQAANKRVACWMQSAGMATHEDSAGNLIGRYESNIANAKRLLIGSHLDTVPNGGKYDGILGVLAPIALIQYLNESRIRLPFHIDIVGFCDEEGTRFGSTLLGSKALTGQWQPEWAQLHDKDEQTLQQAMQAFGLDFDQVSSSKITDKNQLIGYLEWHIEQGPVLEAENLPVGIVTGIAGARRFALEVTGRAGHAGTVPMSLRLDSLTAASEMILCVESLAKAANLVATVGHIDNSPNGVNVIAGHTSFSLDIRSDDDSLRDKVLDNIIHKLNEIAKQRQVDLSFHETHSAPAVICDKHLQNVLANAVEKSGYPALSLSSGAGHDAMAMAEICPVAMLFIRCEKGISHHPDEKVELADVAVSLGVLHHTLENLAQTQTHDLSGVAS